MGGGGVDKFTDFLPFRNSSSKIVTAGSDTYLNYPGLTLSSTAGAPNFPGDKRLFWNYNAGAGLDWTMWDLHWDVENKKTTVATTNGKSHYRPITVRVKVYYKVRPQSCN